MGRKIGLSHLEVSESSAEVYPIPLWGEFTCEILWSSRSFKSLFKELFENQ